MGVIKDKKKKEGKEKFNMKFKKSDREEEWRGVGRTDQREEHHEAGDVADHAAQ